MLAGGHSTDGSQVGTSTSLGHRLCPLVSKNARYFSRSSSVCIGKGSEVRGRRSDRRDPTHGGPNGQIYPTRVGWVEFDGDLVLRGQDFGLRISDWLRSRSRE